MNANRRHFEEGEEVGHQIIEDSGYYIRAGGQWVRDEDQRHERYPSLDGTMVVNWGPGVVAINRVGRFDLDTAVAVHEIDLRPQGDTVASIELVAVDPEAYEHEAHASETRITAELTTGDLTALINRLTEVRDSALADEIEDEWLDMGGEA